MKRLAGLTLLLGFAWGTAWGNQKLEDVIGAMRKAEAGISDIRVEFRNEMQLRATGDRQVITGDIAMTKRPQRFLIRYSSPVEQLAAYDGTALMLYFPATGQAVRQKATMDQLTRMIGVNPVAPTDLFGKGRKARLISCGKKSCILEVSEKSEGSEEGDAERAKTAATTWRLKIDSETWLLEEALMRGEEFEIRIRCHNYRVNEGIEEADVSLKLPEGTEIVEGIPQMFRSMQPGGKE